LAGRRHQAKRQRCHGIRVSHTFHAGHAVVLRQDQRGEHQKQLCAHLRATRRDTRLWVSAELRHGRTQDVHYADGRQVAEQGGADADHVPGHRPDRLASRRHKVSPQRAVPRRAGVRQLAHVAPGTGVVRARCWPHTHEVLPERHARVQVWHQRQDCYGIQGH